MTWHKFPEKQPIPLDTVVAKCREYVNKGNVKNIKEKRLWIKIIANSGHQEIVYSPQSNGGWGSSPLNANNWKTVDDKPIV